jgi:hypothetical protein
MGILFYGRGRGKGAEIRQGESARHLDCSATKSLSPFSVKGGVIFGEKSRGRSKIGEESQEGSHGCGLSRSPTVSVQSADTGCKPTGIILHRFIELRKAVQ